MGSRGPDMAQPVSTNLADTHCNLYVQPALGCITLDLQNRSSLDWARVLQEDGCRWL